MLGLDPNLVVDNIMTYLDAKSIKQKSRKFNPVQSLLIKDELQKLLKSHFIKSIDYPKWVSNMVPISDDLKDTKTIYIGDILNEYEHDLAKSFFIECHEIFAFGYTDMPGLYPNLIVHNIVTYLMPN